MRIESNQRLLQRGLTLAATLFTCVALQADDKKLGEAHGDKSAKFIKEAVRSSQMEVRMGELGQTKAQNQEVKSLAQTLVRDHTAAGQELRQLAQKKNLQLDQKAEHKHTGHLEKLNNASGADFDKEFVTHAVKHHKKDIAKFEKCSADVQDAELKAFIDKTLPKLRQHLEMAQRAARTLGISEASLTELEADEEPEAAGAAAEVEIEAGQSDQPQSDQKLDQQGSIRSDVQIEGQSRLNGATETDNSLTINQNSPAIEAEADLDVDRSDDGTSIRSDIDVDTDKGDGKIGGVDVKEGDGKVLGVRTEKGDNRVLGLDTSKQDGKLLGIIPWRRDNNADVEVEADADLDREESVGGPGVSVSGRASSEQVQFNQLPEQVKSAVRSQGGTESTTVKRMTVYEVNVNGKTMHVSEDGKVYQHDHSGTRSGQGYDSGLKR